MNRSALLILSCCALVLTSCGTQFRREWEKAANSVPPTGSIEGRWEGTWHSRATGHTGKLRCLVGPPCNAEGDHTFTYWANWQHVLSASFKSSHRVKQSGSTIRFRGTHEMPAWVGGTYSYDGKLEKGKFCAEYRSAGDQGTFEMCRPRD